MEHFQTTSKGFLKQFFEFIFEIESAIARKWASSAHKRLFYSQWSISPAPEWFDHSIDLYHLWPKRQNPLWLERGVFGSLAIRGGNVLELSCGDGFNTKHFYSIKSDKIIACDFDVNAIKTAKNKNSSANITFVLADIRYNMPEGNFDNIVWDAAIEHFKPDEISKIMKDIKKRLKSNGILSGYSIVEKDDGTKHLHQHEYEFKSKEDLASFLSPHFKNVKVFETIFPDRHNLYFWASDDLLPFDQDWTAQKTIK